jgi:hypothetical protein
VGDGLLRWDVQSIAKKPDRQFFAERGRHAASGYQKLGGGRVQAVSRCLPDYKYPGGVSHGGLQKLSDGDLGGSRPR